MTTMLQMVTRLIRQQDAIPVVIEDALKMLAAQVDELALELDSMRQARRPTPDPRQTPLPLDGTTVVSAFPHSYSGTRAWTDGPTGTREWMR